jgi:hypothetical protein
MRSILRNACTRGNQKNHLTTSAKETQLSIESRLRSNEPTPPERTPQPSISSSSIPPQLSSLSSSSSKPLNTSSTPRSGTGLPASINFPRATRAERTPSISAKASRIPSTEAKLLSPPRWRFERLRSTKMATFFRVRTEAPPVRYVHRRPWPPQKQLPHTPLKSALPSLRFSFRKETHPFEKGPEFRAQLEQGVLLVSPRDWISKAPAYETWELSSFSRPGRKRGSRFTGKLRDSWESLVLVVRAAAPRRRVVGLSKEPLEG